MFSMTSFVVLVFAYNLDELTFPSKVNSSISEDNFLAWEMFDSWDWVLLSLVCSSCTFWLIWIRPSSPYSWDLADMRWLGMYWPSANLCFLNLYLSTWNPSLFTFPYSCDLAVIRGLGMYRPSANPCFLNWYLLIWNPSFGISPRASLNSFLSSRVPQQHYAHWFPMILKY